jgi:two-component system, OmpR family, response regulator ResD
MVVRPSEEITTNQTVLVVEDDPIVRDVVVRYLTQAGFGTIQAEDGRTAQARFGDGVSAVVLDVMLPGLDGLSFCRWVRGRSGVPIIMLTARGDESDRIVGLEIGADDYVAKPFSPRELVARVRAVLRRGNHDVPSTGRIAVGSVEVDLESREARRDNSVIRLTAREFELLAFLCRNPRHVFSREQLMDRVWLDRGEADPATVTVHVRRLREKIEADPSHPRHLETVWGVGYRFSP